jgi:hypothetical protein
VRFLASTVLASVLLAGGSARADSLSSAEVDKLLRGDSVARTQELHRGIRRYVGGVAYKILDAAPEDLASLLDDVGDWGRFLPKTRDAHRVGAVGNDPLVQITHGSALVQVGYTLRVHRDASSSTWGTASSATCSRTGCASWRWRCPTACATSSSSGRPGVGARRGSRDRTASRCSLAS